MRVSRRHLPVTLRTTLVIALWLCQNANLGHACSDTRGFVNGDAVTSAKEQGDTNMNVECLQPKDNMNGMSDSNRDVSVNTDGAMSDNVDSALALVPYQAPILARFHDDEKSFEFGKHKVRIKQDWNGSGVAAVVWDAAVVLAEYLQANAHLVEGKAVVELGAGTGLAGIVASKLGASETVLTDRESVLEILKANVILNTRQNSHSLERCAGTGDRGTTYPCPGPISVESLEWGSDVAEEHSRYDVILGADIIYIEESFPSLLKTLRDLTRNEKKRAVILLSCRIRYERDTRFVHMLRQRFKVKQVLYDDFRDIYVYKVINEENT